VCSTILGYTHVAVYTCCGIYMLRYIHVAVYTCWGHMLGSTHVMCLHVAVYTCWGDVATCTHPYTCWGHVSTCTHTHVALYTCYTVYTGVMCQHAGFFFKEMSVQPGVRRCVCGGAAYARGGLDSAMARHGDKHPDVAACYTNTCIYMYIPQQMWLHLIPISAT